MPPTKEKHHVTFVDLPQPAHTPPRARPKLPTPQRPGPHRDPPLIAISKQTMLAVKKTHVVQKAKTQVHTKNASQVCTVLKYFYAELCSILKYIVSATECQL